jgi:hypothetical protein
MLQEQAGAQCSQPPGDGIPDARTPADAGHHCCPAAQRQDVSPKLVKRGLTGTHDRQFAAVRGIYARDSGN